MKKKGLFYSRGMFSKLFPLLKFDHIDKYHVVRNKVEKQEVEKRGGNVVGCLEEHWGRLKGVEHESNYLAQGFQANRYLNWVSHEKRQEILKKKIEFIRKVMQTEEYDFVLHETVSNEIEEIISIEAERIKLRDINHVSFMVDGYFLFKPNPYNTSLPKELLEYTNTNRNEEKLAKKQVKKVRQEGVYAEYLHKETEGSALEKVKKMTSSLRRAGRFLNRKLNKIGLNIDWRVSSAVERDIFYSDYFRDENITSIFVNKLHKTTSSYDSIESIKNKNYVLYPMHITPEASVRYFSEYAIRQSFLIQSICRFIPQNMKVIVKDHPNQPKQLLRQEFIRLKKNNPNLYFLPSDIPSEKLIKNAKAIVTISSTVGWEALVYEKPVILAGNTFYDKHEGVTNVRSNIQIKKALNGNVNSPKSIKYSYEYLSKVLSIAYPGRVHHNKFGSADIERLSKSIKNHIEKDIHW